MRLVIFLVENQLDEALYTSTDESAAAAANPHLPNPIKRETFKLVFVARSPNFWPNAPCASNGPDGCAWQS